MNTRRKFISTLGAAGLLPFITGFKKRDLVLPGIPFTAGKVKNGGKTLTLVLLNSCSPV
jgi:hypothetical protein